MPARAIWRALRTGTTSHDLRPAPEREPRPPNRPRLARGSARPAPLSPSWCSSPCGSSQGTLPSGRGPTQTLDPRLAGPARASSDSRMEQGCAEAVTPAGKGQRTGSRRAGGRRGRCGGPHWAASTRAAPRSAPLPGLPQRLSLQPMPVPPSFKSLGNPSPSLRARPPAGHWLSGRHGGLGHGQAANTTNALFQSKGHKGENGAARDQGCAGLWEHVALGAPDRLTSREHEHGQSQHTLRVRSLWRTTPRDMASQSQRSGGGS